MARILYIDDNQMEHDLAWEFFKDGNITISCMNNAKDGLEELANGHYDLAVCDIMMPGDDGLSFARKLSDSSMDTPLLLTSGIHALKSFDEYKGLKNYLGFILKPITPDKIRPYLRGTT